MEYGITDYNQYKKFPFLETESIQRLKNKVLTQIRDGFRFPERLIILGVPGIGKTSSLFFCEDMLKESPHCNVLFFSKFITSIEDFELEVGVKFLTLTKKPTYILIDFPDNFGSKKYKDFLEFVWILLTHKNYANINLIFSMNISHFDKSFSFSEVLGKFDKFRLEKMEYSESEKMISSRLSIAGLNGLFSEPVKKIVYKYSKGIPRNIICFSKNLTENFFDRDVIEEADAYKLMKENYIDQIIDDRVEDSSKRIIYKKVVEIIHEDFGGEAAAQSKLVDTITQKILIGRNKAMLILSDLHKYGVVSFSRGGERNHLKIVSLK